MDRSHRSGRWTPVVVGARAGWCVAAGSVIAVLLLVAGASPGFDDPLVAVAGVLSLVLSGLTVALAWGRTPLAWLAVPLVLLAAWSALALLAPDSEGFFVLGYVTSPLAVVWMIFAFAAWKRIGETPVPVRGGESSTE